MDDLLALLVAARHHTGITALAFALFAFACDRFGYKIMSPFLACRRMAALRLRGFGVILAIALTLGAKRTSTALDPGLPQR